ncbi:MAG TPA: IS3 family transposase [Clostridiales bacterium]|nr:IS3 family transposase [Clostridiales bacterium]
MSGKTRNYTEEFKKQIVCLYRNGKSAGNIADEYGVGKSTVLKWVKDFNNSGPFRAKDNRTDEENELIRLQKENKQLLMENDILKQAALILCTKIDLILSNKNKHSISAMCRVLNIPRSLVYYRKKARKIDGRLENEVFRIFKESRNNYGTRKIKIELKKLDIIASRQKISSIMNKYNLISNYTIKQFKVHKTGCNNDKIENVVNCEFNNRNNLTYVRVKNKWCSICLLINLFNREIVGFSAGPNKTAELVYEAFINSNVNLLEVQVFHTDRGSEFKNKQIDEVLTAFNIKRSLSHKGCPYDNAVAEATYKIFKTEFAFNRIFDSLEHLNAQLADFVNWFNNKRIRGTLNYMSPVEYRNAISSK